MKTKVVTYVEVDPETREEAVSEIRLTTWMDHEREGKRNYGTLGSRTVRYEEG